VRSSAEPGGRAGAAASSGTRRSGPAARAISTTASGVAGAALHDRLHHPRRRPHGQRRHQRAALVGGEGAELDRRQPPDPGVDGHLGPHRQQQRDPLGPETPGHEHQHLLGRCVDPREVVDDEQQRLGVGGRGEGAQGGRAHGERAADAAGAQREGDLERLPLDLREALDVLEERHQQVGGRGEREHRLALDPRRAQDPARRRPDDLVEQRRLPAARFAGEDGDRSVGAPRVGRGGELCPLARATDDLG